MPALEMNPSNSTDKSNLNKESEATKPAKASASRNRSRFDTPLQRFIMMATVAWEGLISLGWFPHMWIESLLGPFDEVIYFALFNKSSEYYIWDYRILSFL